MRDPKFWSHRGSVLAALLSPLGALYGASVKLRHARANPFRPKARVVCVGNLTAGGSGKTPIAIALARICVGRGLKPMFLTRGYGGRLAWPVLVDPHQHASADVGDEPLLLAATAPTIVARDRAAGAKLADTLGADLIVMDDGFQNFQIVKDLSFVVVDATLGFGNGHLIPAGPLREPVSQGLARADALVLMGDGDPAIAFTGPVLRARTIAAAPEALKDRAVFAFAGIGNPERFFALLRNAGASVVGTQAFADHHRFSELELSVLRLGCEKFGALCVTTEKDYFRLEPRQRARIVPVPVFARFDDDGASLNALLDRVARARNEGAA
ncbi:MAG: tetraacyldisaccharide 4'-kinase [Alphaproteobacteria bacterium]|nr:tetraacyldisaccharide 4'-kinase [Alphaproteobacteria bacterium]